MTLLKDTTSWELQIWIGRLLTYQRTLYQGGGKNTIDALASQFSENGKRCQEVSQSITSTCGKAPDSKGDSAKQLQQSLSQVAQFAGRLSEVHGNINQALRSWGSAVDTSQDTAYKDCRRAMDLRDSIAKNRKKIDQAKQTLKKPAII